MSFVEALDRFLLRVLGCDRFCHPTNRVTSGTARFDVITETRVAQ
jgi:hypothetical protein